MESCGWNVLHGVYSKMARNKKRAIARSEIEGEGEGPSQAAGKDAEMEQRVLIRSIFARPGWMHLFHSSSQVV